MILDTPSARSKQHNREQNGSAKTPRNAKRFQNLGFQNLIFRISYVGFRIRILGYPWRSGVLALPFFFFQFEFQQPAPKCDSSVARSDKSTSPSASRSPSLGSGAGLP